MGHTHAFAKSSTASQLMKYRLNPQSTLSKQLVEFSQHGDYIPMIPNHPRPGARIIPCVTVYEGKFPVLEGARASVEDFFYFLENMVQ